MKAGIYIEHSKMNRMVQKTLNTTFQIQIIINQINSFILVKIIITLSTGKATTTSNFWSGIRLKFHVQMQYK